MDLLSEIIENHDRRKEDVDDAGACWRCNSQWSEPEICAICETCPDCCECGDKEK